MAQQWKVIGGADKGGILVRAGAGLDSKKLDERLSTGALVEELGKEGDRLNYRLIEGTGPAEGWCALQVSGKVLVEEVIRPVAPPPSKVGPDDLEPLPVALFFPGQGSQYVKMMAGVKDMPAVQEMLAQANEILGYDILDLCLNGPEEKLEETRYCQPAMFIAGLAGVEKMRADPELKPKVGQAAIMAGLSLGEYTALCAAGVMDFADGLKLVKLRGEAMHEAAQQGKQLMLSVAGLEKAKLAPLCEQAKKAEGTGAVCSIANSLFPAGYSVGGTETAINKLKDLAEKNGALQAKVLKTAGAFHTALMQPAQDKLVEALEETLPRMRSPLHTIYMNANARPVRPGCSPKDDILPLMKKQLTNPVLWEDSVKAMIADEKITDFFEVGPMKQMKAMMKRIDPTPWKKMVNIEI